MDTLAYQNLNIPYFLLQYLIDSNTKVQEENSQQLAHHGLINILVEEPLHTLTISIAWKVFRNMTVEDDIKALTYDVSPTVNEEGEQQGGEDVASGDIAEHKRKEERKEIEEGREKETEQEEEKETEEVEKEVERAEQREESPKTLEREEETALTALSTPVNQKQKRKRKTSM